MGKTKKQIIAEIENAGKYCKVRITPGGSITGYLTSEDYPFNKITNTGGRRLIGNIFPARER